MRLGLKSGTAAITRTRPVCGSIATTEPARPASAWSAVRWPAGSSVVSRSSPSRSLPRSSSKKLRELVLVSGQLVVVRALECPPGRAPTKL